MISFIDRGGVFEGSIVDGAISQTKNGFPQYEVQVVSSALFASSPEDMEYYKIAEPGYQTYPEETCRGWLVLANASRNFDWILEPLVALGFNPMDPASIDALNGSSIVFRVEKGPTGKFSVTAIGPRGTDLNAGGGIKKLDAATVKSILAKLHAPPKAPAKPATTLKAAVTAAPTARPLGTGTLAASKSIVTASPAVSTQPAPAAVAPTTAPAVIAAPPKVGRTKRTAPVTTYGREQMVADFTTYASGLGVSASDIAAVLNHVAPEGATIADWKATLEQAKGCIQVDVPTT